ncbi:tRNA uridine-5-carboxymethylaminomethyl(34) synthesis GTPase MnmE [Sphingomonas astaxanthinifaciens]|uniref:tRNA modification GTPase MnmE n=1 Tax=Sphingomonas astaxanthinifaciens DSM 22298 TaxID=1123267 RepID=A0ABQ5Z5Y3_9SPHN|nr:tRNA uridine-5-carboxymethylaminomethyl(34) synthesis GTPase MnmE [Sphingomonas astaxanthinifaciens]GLR46771.1 tRNA modification GTPase MnmE [Sphingomonas astaxanthinifaciens DSM 22298]
MGDTIFALSSGALPAAVAIVRCSGPRAIAAGHQLAGSLPPPRQLGLRALIAADGALIDRALVVQFPGPSTATGEDLLEFHLHGGRAVVARLLDELGRIPGLRPAEPGEFTRRALVNGRLDLTEAEGLGDLLAAETEWQRRAAAQAAGGALSRQIEEWRSALLLLAAEAEAAIDYVDEEETELDLSALARRASGLASQWREWLRAPRSETLSEGLSVVLAGPPNAGKSSLFNALIGDDKAIVTAIPGTTRDLIEARLDVEGLPLTLVDTAGLRDSDDEVERIGVSRAARAQATADILLWLGDPNDAPAHPHRLLLIARADARSLEEPHPGSIAVSARTGEGIDRLRREVAEIARTLLPPPDRATLNLRQAQVLSAAADALELARADDALLTAEAVRQALHALDRMTGRQSTEDMLDTLFSRFCLGK